MSIGNVLAASCQLLAAVALAGCGKGNSQMSDIAISIRGAEYKIPKTHVRGAALSPREMAFIRINPPDEDFDLILDAFDPYLANKQGPDVPTISRLNSNRFGRFEVIASAVGPVVCSLGPEIHFDCGFEISDGNVKWDVLFDRVNLAKSSTYKRSAERMIESYRS